ncbi:MAG: phenazine-specific anthranilate synthase [Propionibacteriales bacterium]|nr:phenazine-specific anthranilate synthase [Propionibacteriales bacterium]
MALIDDLSASAAYALVRFGAADSVTVLRGDRHEYDQLLDVPLVAGSPESGRRFDRLLCVPYRQIRERGFAANDDQTPLADITITHEMEVPLGELLSELPDIALQTVGDRGFDIDDDAYAKLVDAIITDEIGNGEAANLVIARNYRATVADWDLARALSVFRRLLTDERGAYWTFLVYTGDRYLLGASPERHISVRQGLVTMNPISGTFRVGAGIDPAVRKTELLDFLADEKEIYELFMVVDEELKMMCDICSEGGQILGPYLKPMTHLIHTEYVLEGHTNKDVREVLRDSMFAATVTGSPVENACRLIARYEDEGRGYYGAVMALLGRDTGGSPTLDAPILLRTADVGTDGRLRVATGATLVRDSDPHSEVAETHAKAGGILRAFGLVPAPTAPVGEVRELADDADVRAALGQRNRRLSRFWLNDQSDASRSSELAGRHVVILDGEDDFVTMLRHILSVLGLTSETIRHHDYQVGAFSAADLVIVGPGPGDPRRLDDARISAVSAAIDDLLRDERPFLGVCLGHQVLCGALGLPLDFKDIVFQGTQTQVKILGREERVGFYNTFVARTGTVSLPAGVAVDRDPTSGDVHLVSGPHYRGVQFHAESILTEHGFDIIRELLVDLLDR